MSKLPVWLKQILLVNVIVVLWVTTLDKSEAQLVQSNHPLATIGFPVSQPIRKLEIIPIQTAPTQSDPKPDSVPSVSKGEMEKAVQEYMERQAEKKKKEEATKKKQEEDKGYVVGSDPVLKAFWSNQGLTFQSANQDFRVHVGGRFSADAAWFAAGEELQTGPGGVGELEDGASFRRGRVRVDGTMYENFQWISEFAFDTPLQGQTTHPGFIDVYGEISHLPWIGNFRAGHFREPLSMEGLSSGNGLAFMERSSSFEAFVPFRNIGIMVFNTAFDERMTWATGLFRANSSNAGNPFDNGDGEYATTSRITVLPWYEEEGQCLLHLGIAYSHRSFSTAPGQNQARFRSFGEVRVGPYIFADSGFLTVESTDLIGLELACNYGPLCLQAEYYHAWVQDARIDGNLTNPQFHGGYIQLSYFLTGEHRVYSKRAAVLDRPRPFENFFWIQKESEEHGSKISRWGTGAWEAGIRYSWVDVNDPGQGVNAQVAQDVTFGLNWYLNPHTIMQWNYIIIDRDFPSQNNSGVAHIFGTRFHMDF